MLNPKIILGNMPEYIFNENVLIAGVIIIFIIWLIYRIKNRVKHTIINEIYRHFPAIKDDMDSFEQRLNYLNNRLAEFERKINELEIKTKKI